MWLFHRWDSLSPDTAAVCGYGITQNYLHNKSWIWLSDVFGSVSVVEITGSSAHHSFGMLMWHKDTFDLTVLPSVMSALPACTSASRAGYLCDNPPDSQTPSLCEKIYHLHSLSKRKTKLFCTNQFPVDNCVYCVRSSAKMISSTQRTRPHPR